MAEDQQGQGRRVSRATTDDTRRTAVSIPYYGRKSTIMRCVESVLNQTESNLMAIVTNDGDPDPPWPELASLEDPRLYMFELSRNMGPYFATAIVVGAAKSQYLLIQDADDWSEPARLQRLMAVANRTGCGLATSGIVWYLPGKDPSYEDMNDKLSDPNVASRASDRVRHTGLFSIEILRRLGGYYGGFRIGYDTFIVNTLTLAGLVEYVNEPLYHKELHEGSLTTSPLTGIGSKYRNEVRDQIKYMYQKVVDDHGTYGTDPLEAARQVSRQNVSSEDEIYLRKCIRKMSHSLQRPAREPILLG